MAFPAKAEFSVIPQVQLSYVSSSLSVKDRFNPQVGSDKGDSLQGRPGIAFDYHRDRPDAAGHASHRKKKASSF